MTDTRRAKAVRNRPKNQNPWRAEPCDAGPTRGEPARLGKKPLVYRTELRRRAAVPRLGRCRFAAHYFKLFNAEAADLELVDPELLYLAAPDRESPDCERADSERTDRESPHSKRAHAPCSERRVPHLSGGRLL